MKHYRVRFSLTDDLAQKYDTVQNKSSLLALALKWFLSYGLESINMLNRIESILVSGVQIEKGAPKIVETKRDAIDDIFDKFVI